MDDLVSELLRRVDIVIPDSQLMESLDRYRQYTEDLILPSGEPFSRLYIESSHIDEGCEDCLRSDAQLECSINSDCICVEHTGNFYDDRGLLMLHALPPNLPLVECGDTCACSIACSMRVSQKGPSKSLALHQSKAGGLGLLATAPLARGHFVCLYAGEFIGEDEARRRFAKQEADGQGNYMLCMRENDVVLGFVDPTYVGNVGRFLNYSCDANCKMEYVRWGASVIPRPALYANRDIAAGEELTWDYGDTAIARASRYEGDYESAKVTACACGSANCVGFLPFDPSV